MELHNSPKTGRKLKRLFLRVSLAFRLDQRDKPDDDDGERRFLVVNIS